MSSAIKCLDGWIWFKQSCYLLGETDMKFVHAKVGNDFFCVEFTFVNS